MNSLEWRAIALMKNNRDGSRLTQTKRGYVLKQVARDLHSVGFKVQKWENIKEKHVEKLIEHWKKKGLATSTMKDRMSYVRWALDKSGNQHSIQKNQNLGIPNRQYVKNEDKSWDTKEYNKVLDAVYEKNQNLGFQMELMKEFGLRFKESCTFRPNRDVDLVNNTIRVHHGTKGGRLREVPIRNDSQKGLIEDLQKKFKGENSLTPTDTTYIQWKKRAYNIARESGITKDLKGTFHGLRHAYAQEIYKKQTGFKAPVKMNREEWSELIKNPFMKKKDEEVRKMIAEELGHGRIDVVSQYLGSKPR